MLADPALRARVADDLARAGCVAPTAEADELLAVATEVSDLEALLARRRDGEPLAWIVGSTTFGGRRHRTDVGVYVPRPHSELVARAALAALPEMGIAYDVATGSGAVAAFLVEHRPQATVIGLDLDPAAVACARQNGVDARVADLLDGIEAQHVGGVDVVVAVLPYVPRPHLPLLARDTLAHEDVRWYDGGPDGTDLLARLLPQAARALRPGGTLVVELGADQLDRLARSLDAVGLAVSDRLLDDEGDVRGLAARRR